MTDKEKFRKEVEKLKSNLMYGACSSQIAMETMCKEEAYNEVLAILDTVQEEPKHKFNVGDKVQSVSGKIAKIESVDTDKYWCIGEQGMSIPFKYQDQWELVEESKQCMYSRDNYTEEDRKVLCEGCEEKCEFNQVKESAILQHKEETCKENSDSLTQEPVSEELDEAAYTYAANNGGRWLTDDIGIKCFAFNPQEVEDAFKAGAKWQKKRDYIPLSDDINEVARQICNKVLNCEIDYKENDVVLSDEEECVKAGIRWQMQKESIPSKDLEELINSLSKHYPEMSFAKLSRIAVRVAKWKVENLWKPADGDDLPEIDREVIVLIKYNAQRNVHDKEYSTYRVGFGHRPNPNGWDGKNIDTNEVTHYTPKLYDKGCWNAPDIVYWLDIELPKEIEL